MPDFPKNVGLRISTLHHFAEFTPEIMIYFIGYVEAPTIDSNFCNPEFSDLQ
ncbi:hypothetical protein D3C79_1021540 [compost metagenome]